MRNGKSVSTFYGLAMKADRSDDLAKGKLFHSAAINADGADDFVEYFQNRAAGLATITVNGKNVKAETVYKRVVIRNAAKDGDPSAADATRAKADAVSSTNFAKYAEEIVEWTGGDLAGFAEITERVGYSFKAARRIIRPAVATGKQDGSGQDGSGQDGQDGGQETPNAIPNRADIVACLRPLFAAAGINDGSGLFGVVREHATNMANALSAYAELHPESDGEESEEK